MKFEFDTDDVRGWIVDCAEEVWNYYEADPDSFDLPEAVYDTMEGYIDGRTDALAVIAYYVMEDKCLAGDVDFDDSPYSQFENDVYEEIPFVFKKHGKKLDLIDGTITDSEEE